MTSEGAVPKRHTHILAETLGRPAVAGVIVVLALLLTAAAWYGSRQAIHDRAEQRFAFQVDELRTAINDRMIGYEQVLWGGAGLFNASDSVSRDEWREYVETVNIQQHWPGIQGLGFSTPIDPDELDAHITAIRAEGFPDYTVRPEDERDDYTAIVYLEPFDERNQRAFGFDMWSNPVRREAMARARDTGVAATSGAITLVQETDDDVQRGFLTYVPIYAGGTAPPTVAERREALEGWVYAPFRAGDLMNGIVGDDFEGIGFEVFAGDEPVEAALLFDSDGELHGAERAPGDDFVTVERLAVQGQEWTIAFHSGPQFLNPTEARQPTLIAIAGLTFNLLILYVLASMGYVQRRAVSLAKSMTSELRSTQRVLEARSDELQGLADELKESNAELEKSNSDLEQFIFTAAHDLKAPLRTVSSYAILLEDAAADISDDGRTYLARITGSVGRMNELLTDLLAYARLGVDRPAQPVDLAQLVATVVDDIVAAGAAEVSIGPLPVVVGHEHHLRLLLQNLVDNAVKFARPDVPLRIAIEADEQDSLVVVSVSDNGVGFDPEYSDRIFSVFQRLPGSADVPGTGIGLAHCRRIARMHHGDAWATSTPGVGSTFSFSLTTRTASELATVGGRSPQ